MIAPCWLFINPMYDLRLFNFSVVMKKLFQKQFFSSYQLQSTFLLFPEEINVTMNFSVESSHHEDVGFGVGWLVSPLMGDVEGIDDGLLDDKSVGMELG